MGSVVELWPGLDKGTFFCFVISQALAREFGDTFPTNFSDASESYSLSVVSVSNSAELASLSKDPLKSLP